MFAMTEESIRRSPVRKPRLHSQSMFEKTRVTESYAAICRGPSRRFRSHPGNPGLTYRRCLPLNERVDCRALSVLLAGWFDPRLRHQASDQRWQRYKALQAQLQWREG